MYCNMLSKQLVSSLTGPDAKIKVLDDKAEAGGRSCVLKDDARSEVVISASVDPRHYDDAGMRKLVDDGMAYWEGQDIPVPKLSEQGYARASIDEVSSVYLALATPESYIRVIYTPTQARRESAGDDVTEIAEDLIENVPPPGSPSAPGPSKTVTSMSTNQAPSGFLSRLSDRMG